MSNFALRMKELRKERKLKQQELADEFSVKLRTYQGYEYGESYPEVAKLLAIADFFDVSLDYLMGRSDVRERRWRFGGFTYDVPLYDFRWQYRDCPLRDEGGWPGEGISGASGCEGRFSPCHMLAAWI